MNRAATNRPAPCWRGALASACLLLAPMPLLAQAGDPAVARPIVERLCVACHGTDGNGTQPAYPKLAGLQPEYLAKQLRDFKSGSRKSAVMAPMVAPLSEQEIDSLAAYYSQGKPARSAVRDKALAEAGRRIYLDGVVETGVPSCSGCHYPDGMGTRRFPRLAGQHADYVVQQMKEFAAGRRDNDRGLVMQSLAVRMNEQQFRAVAEFIAGME